jgi:hypothetical protein
MKTVFTPGTSEKDVFTLDTAAGRARIFQKRLDEIVAQLTASGKRSTIDDAIYELRTSNDPNDQQLLVAMGENPSAFRSEHLKREKFLTDMHQAARDIAAAQKPSTEVTAAIKAAQNDRATAFNSRVDELMREGFDFDAAIRQMRANAADAALIESMQQPINK